MKRRRKRRMTTVPVASMGDIAFLLIIFFMICSNFAREADIRLELPRERTLEAMEETPVSVSIDENNKVYFQGEPVAGPDAVEARLTPIIESKTTQKGRTVLFKCDRNVSKDIYEPVLDAIAGSGALIAAIGERGAAQ